MKILKIIFVILFIFAAHTSAQVKKFEIPAGDFYLSRSAQPHQYMDKIGSKAALIGFEDASFEMWIWPWKVLRRFELQFFIGTSTRPIFASEILREITVTPEATTISFVYESFTVKEIIFIPHDKPGAVILLDVFTTTPLTIVPGFMPVMQPQWPAGIGGQYSYWDDNLKAYIISESQRRATFVCGSPIAEKMAAPPAHMFADNPIQFKFTVEPGKSNDFFYPIVIAGLHKQHRDSVFALYNDLAANADKYFNLTKNFYRQLRESTIDVVTSDEKVNLAFQFGKVALANLMVENPVLGQGLVAGYGLSGGGGRPGFAWYFGGDAYINSMAMTSFGYYSAVKEALQFTQKWQRQENFPIRKRTRDEKNNDIGKMAHELSQSDGLIDWWNDYHYGYNHADTTPWYLVAIGDYFRKTGDIGFISKSWKSIKAAYNWCLGKDSNGDGLMDLKGAGLGVLEFGPLVKIFNDLYTQGLWAQAIKEMNLMARYVGDKEMELHASKLLAQAVESLEKIFWMEDLGYYSFAAAEDGLQVKDKNIFPTSIMIFNLLDSTRCASSVRNFNYSDMITDWGVRNLSNKSALYEPTNYNYGTVWGFNSLFANSAQFKYNFNLAAHSLFYNTLQHAFDYGLGVFPEVFSGDINTKLGEAYHNQGFCTSGYIYPMMTGLLGLDLNALENKVAFSPKIPADWKYLKINNIKIAGSTLSCSLKIENDEKLLAGNMEMIVENSGLGRTKFSFWPNLPAGSTILEAKLNGHRLDTRNGSEGKNQFFEFELEKEAHLSIKYKSVPALFIIPRAAPIGATNEGIKIVSQRIEAGKIITETEIIPGKHYEIGIINAGLISTIEGAELADGKIKIFVPGTGKDFIKHEIKIEPK